MENQLIKILIVDDNPADARLIKEMLIDTGACDMTSLMHAMRYDEALEHAGKGGFDVILLDLMLPDSQGLETFTGVFSKAKGVPIVVLTGLSDEDMAARAVREGAQDYLVKGHVDTGILLRAMRFAIERRRQVLERASPKPSSRPKDTERGLNIVGESTGIKEVEDFISVVANTFNTSVLIHGETGTGKGLVAKAIHFASSRRNNPFIELNCSAIPESLLESEMFGYEKGAFTDAKQNKKGLFELADGGTIFLDEIGDMDMRLQPKLLQFLEGRTFRKVGGTKDMKVDLRVIAATNHDLEALVRDKRFREDLYYRLKVMVITIPPLRERKKDIIPLAEYFIRSYSDGGAGKRLTAECREMLLDYSWPGNVRELKNVIERAMILSRDGDIGPSHLPREVLKESHENRPANALFPGDMTLEEMERAYIRTVLERAGGNKSLASKVLGISRLTLRKKLKDLGEGDGE